MSLPAPRDKAPAAVKASDDFARDAVQILASMRQHLDVAESLEDVKSLMQRADFMRVAAKKAKVATEIQLDVEEYALDAERKAGQMLGGIELAKGGNQDKIIQPVPDEDGLDDQAPTLEDLGITRKESSRWKRIAALPDDDYEAYKAEARAKGEVTKAGAVKKAKEIAQAAAREERETTLKAQADAAADDGLIEHSDILDFIARLDDGSVHLLATDPPYAVTDNAWDVWPTEDAFWEFMTGWLSALRPKMADEFTAFIFCDADASPRLHATLLDTDWPVLRQAIWHRPNLAKKRSGSMTFLSAYEPFWHCGTRALNLPDEWGEERFDVQKVVVPQSTHKVDPSYHPTQKPIELMERLVRIGSYPGELVIDPFCGSGTTPLAAEKVGGRSYRSCDQNADYVRIARGRIAQHREAAA